MLRVTHILRIAENAFSTTLNNGLWFLSDVVGIYERKETQRSDKKSGSAKPNNAVLKPASAKKFPSPAKPCGSCCSPPVLRGKDRGEGMAGDIILPGSPSSTGSRAASSGSAGRSVCGVFALAAVRCYS